MLASVPVHGALPLTLRLARRHPITFARVSTTINLAPWVKTEAVVRDLFVTPANPDDVVRRCHQRVSNESYLDLLGLVRLRPSRVTTPVLVFGAQQDRIISVMRLCAPPAPTAPPRRSCPAATT